MDKIQCDYDAENISYSVVVISSLSAYPPADSLHQLHALKTLADGRTLPGRWLCQQPLAFQLLGNLFSFAARGHLRGGAENSYRATRRQASYASPEMTRRTSGCWFTGL